MLILRPKWTRQPPSARVAARWRSSISDVLLPHTRRTLVNGLAATISGTTQSTGQGAPGQGRQFTDSTAYDSYAGGRWVGKSANFSVLLLYEFLTVPAATRRTLTNWTSLTSGWTFSPTSTNFRVVLGAAGANISLTGPSSSLGVKCDVLTSTGTSSVYYQNGAVGASNSSHAAIVANTNPIYVGADAGTSGANQRIYLVAVFDRVLTAAEVAELSANPWQLFEPRRIVIPSPAAAGGFLGAWVRRPSRVIGAGVN